MGIWTSNPSSMFRFNGMSQLAKAGRLIFISGQVAVDERGVLVGGQDVEGQLHKIWANLGIACKEAGCDLVNLVKTTTFITKPESFAAVSAIRAELFGSGGPANTTIIVAALAKQEWLAEIEGVAYIDA